MAENQGPAESNQPHRKPPLGKVPEWALPAQPAPTSDEQWLFVSEHLAAIRRHLAVIAAIVAITFACGVAWVLWLLSQTGSNNGY